MKPSVVELFTDLKRIVERIPVDLVGGCPLSKSFLMAYLALELDLKTYVEIGVYRGRSFLPMAYASKVLGGMAHGIDPYDAETAKEYDLDPALGQRVNCFLDELDFPRIKKELQDLRDELDLAATTEIITERSAVAVDLLARNHVTIDMLHIDGNHDTRHVMEDVARYLPLVRAGGLVVIDDIDWPSVTPALHTAELTLETIFNNGRFAILHRSVPETSLPFPERQRFDILHAMVENLEPDPALPATLVSVIVLSYNHARYIARCLEGILAQQGDFRIELVIGDDSSTDTSREVIRAYLDNLRNPRVDVKILPSDVNVGVSRNVQRCLAACTGRYIAICEGDDYWLDRDKLRLQMDFLQSHPGCSLCFNDFHILSQETGEFSPFDLQELITEDTLTTRDLVHAHFIGNLSCCMYDARHVRELPAGLFDLFIGDWMLNICYSRFGDIGHLKRKMSVYRRHRDGLWSGAPPSERARLLHGYIETYNRFLDYEFDADFSRHRKDLEAAYPAELQRPPWDIAILDDVFPHPLSAFRVQEFNSYLEAFASIKIFASGASVRVLGTDTLPELVSAFKRTHPEHAGHLEILDSDSVVNARLIYTVFLGNTFQHIDAIEASRTPFVFTLYPGGLFGLNNLVSDRMLRRVTSSRYFRKVIVTQRATYDYLLAHRFCTPDQIEFIFGVVTPLPQIEHPAGSKKHFGIDKCTLDVCFVAHKYSAHGVDKGYDVFIDVARALSRRHDDIHFHVVGGFGEHEINVTDFRDRITFHGPRDMAWFDEFYKDKDIILSPNVPFMIFGGSFDGFPTGACVDAGLRKTAIFATDELHLNPHFVDGEDIVIIPHDAATIASIVERYYRDPEKLKTLAVTGAHTIQRLYSSEAQIVPRVNILKTQLDRTRPRKATARPFLTPAAPPGIRRSIALRVSLRLWRACPDELQARVRRGLRRVRSNQALFRAIRLVCPAPLIRLYRKVRESGVQPLT